MRQLAPLLLISFAAALTTSCGGGGGGGSGSGSGQPPPPPVSAASFLLSAYYDVAGTHTFNLSQIVTNSTATTTGTFNNPGAVDLGATSSTQISYVDQIYHPDTQSFSSVIMRLSGSFNIPANSLTYGHVSGTTGTVTGVSESYDGMPIFQVSNLSVDAGVVTNALAGADYISFWHALALHGLDGATSTSIGMVNVYCNTNNTGAVLVLSSNSGSITSFINNCY